MVRLMSYPGGKSRCFQKIVSLMPPHETYIETHLGAGSVILNKLPAKRSIGIDRDARVIDRFKEASSPFELHCCDAEDFLRSWNWTGDELVYCDPPYLPSSRRSNRVYKYEYTSEGHDSLLECLASLPCSVMVSGYRSEKYDLFLKDWKRVDFGYASQTGGRVESLWMNFSPLLRHDSRYVGWDFRGREAFKRKRGRWKKRFLSLPFEQKQAIFEDLKETFEDCKNAVSAHESAPPYES